MNAQPSTITLGQTTHIFVNVTNTASAAQWGNLTVDFPGASAGSLSIVAAHTTFSATPTVVPTGTVIQGCYSVCKVTTTYPAVVAFQAPWAASSTYELEVAYTPTTSGALNYFVKATMGAQGIDQATEWVPLSNAVTDQQRENVTSYSITVNPSASHTVTLSINPATGGGYLTSGANSYYNGQPLTVPTAGLTIGFVANPGWHWVAPYGTTLADSVSGSTLTATSNGGKLFLNFTQYPLVTYVVNPSTCSPLANAINTTGTVAAMTTGGTSNFFDVYGTQAPMPNPLGISAPACAGNTFTTWGAGPAITFGSAATTATNTITKLTSNATLWANYTATPNPTVTFILNPGTGAGAVRVNGVAYYNSQTESTLAAGTYSLAAVVDPWAHFSTWGTSAGLAIGAGTVTITRTGNLYVNFTGYPLLTFATNPTACSPLDFNGSLQATGSSAHYMASGSPFNIGALVCSGETWSTWTSTGGVSVATPTSASTTATLTLPNGTLTANYAAVSTYTVTFNEVGVQTWLPTWGVTLNGVAKTAAPGVAISFTVNTGTSYSYSVPTLAVNTWVQDLPSPASGTGSSAATISTTFTVQDLLTMAVAPAASGTVGPGTGWVADGVGVSISAGAAPGYSFSSWTGAPAARGAYSGTNDPQTVTPSGGGINETANFVAATTYAVTFSESGVQAWFPTWGVTLNGVTKTAAPGVSITFNLPTGTSYSYTVPTIAVNAWVQDVPTPNSGSGSVAATIPVAFQVQDLLTTAVSPAASGTVSPGTGWVADGVGVAISAGPASGYAFSSWTGAPAARGAYSGTNNPQTVTPSGGGINETANFAALTSYTVSFSETGVQAWYPTWGVTLNGVTKTAAPGVGISFTIPTGTSYSYTVGTIAVNAWVQDVPGPSSGSGSTAATVAVTFQIQDLLTMAVSPAASGSVSPGTGWIADGVGVAISAGAAAGYSFGAWMGTPAARGAYSGTNDPQTVTPSGGGINETADFTAATTYAVTFSESGVQGWWASWGVTLNGVSKTAAPGVSITFNVPTGTPYSYTVPSIAVNTWVQDIPVPASGSGSAAATVAVAFAVEDLLTMAVAPAASGTVSPGTGWVPAGSIVSISAGPASGYVFSSWTGTGATGAYSGTNDPQSITVNGGINETANFAATTTYTVTFTESGVQTWWASWGVTLDGVTKTAAPGGSISFSVPTGQSYSFTVGSIAVNTWVQDVPSPASGSGSTTATVAVAFSVKDLLTMSVSPVNSGTVSPGTEWVATGTPVTISAGAAAGYVFSSWAGTGASGAYSGASNPDTITVNGGINETANFVAPGTYTVTFTETGVQSWIATWSVTLNGVTNTAALGSPINFIVTTGTSYSYSVSTITVNTWVQDQPSPSGGTGSSAATIAITYTVEDLLTTAVSPASSGTVSPATGWVPDLTPVSLSAGPASGYAFGSWTGTGATGAYSGSNNPQSITVNGGINETANFVPTTTYTVTFTETGVQAWWSGWGVTLNGVTTTSLPGAPVVFNVPTGQSYSYTVGMITVNGWVEDLPSPSSGSGSSAATIAVAFAVEDLLTMSVAPASSGTVSPGTGWVADGSSVSISAGPAAGYAFSAWTGTGASGAYSGANDPQTLTVNGGINETATFVTSGGTYTVTFTETGVQSWLSAWSVTLDGVTNSAAPGASISFTVANGQSYSFSVANIVDNTWVQDVPSPASGTGSAATTVAVTFSAEDLLTMAFAPSGSGTVSPGTEWVADGSSVAISAGAASGYVFSSWTGTGATGAYTGTNDPQTITVNGGINETATFVASGSYTVTFTETGLQSWYPSWSVTLNGVTNSAAPGASISFSVPTGQSYGYTVGAILPNAWQIDRPTPGSGSGSSAATLPQTFLIFDQVAMTATPSAGGSVAPGTVFVQDGSTLTMWANASAGYTFSSWTGTGASGAYSGTTDPVTSTVNGGINETANFVAIPPPPTFAVTFTETNLATGTSWSVSLNGATMTSTSATITFTEPDGTYGFAVQDPVAGGGGIQYVPAPPTGSLTVSGAAASQTIAFSAWYYLGVSASPASDGTASPASGWFVSGSTLALTAVPAAGYAFSAWAGTGTGSYSGASDPASLTLNGPVNETATFSALPTMYVVAIATSPTGCGAIVLNSVPYTDGATATLAAGTYSISATACPGFALSGAISASGGVSITSGSAKVSGNGGLSATFVSSAPAPLTWIAGTVAPGTAAVMLDNRSVTVTGGMFNVSVSGGHHYLWAWQTGYIGWFTNLTVPTGTHAFVTISLEAVPTTTQTSPGNSNGLLFSGSGIPLWAFLLLLLVLIGVIIVLAVALRKRRNPPPPLEEAASGAAMGATAGGAEAAPDATEAPPPPPPPPSEETQDASTEAQPAPEETGSVEQGGSGEVQVESPPGENDGDESAPDG
ncbi:MAG: hypothetical protein KGI89_15540 [Euryarchaeota archaeon]|nr:hypothetical protein [Euryarchaeota archaeon]